MLVLPPTIWGERELRWGERTFVMAILNITPDSFSGDGRAGMDPAAIAAEAAQAVADGAHILDLGAESTRPGHAEISAEEELGRLLPPLRAVRAATDALISVDTAKAAVAEAALAAGADLVNDVRGFTRDPEMAALVARAGVPAVVMHDVRPDDRGDLVTSVLRELSRRLDRALAAGVAWEMLIVDPGFGFGKDWRQNLVLLNRMDELRTLGRPILSGTSRKRAIGHVLGTPPDDRVEGTAATVALSIDRGADIVRVHDVKAMARVARMTDAIVRPPEYVTDQLPDQPGPRHA